VCAEHLLPITVLVQGGIASGKSTIAKMIAAEGGEYVDCDVLAHEALEQEAAKAQLRSIFGDGIFSDDGRVDRKALADIVFSGDGSLVKLEAVIHPLVVAEVRARIKAAQTTGDRKVVVIDAAVAERMAQSGMPTDSFDLRVFVSTTSETRTRRALEIRGWNAGELERREARQNTLDSKRSGADCVVSNDGDLEEAESHVKRFWAEHVKPRI
jgi:dephospho-CoA kinase